MWKKKISILCICFMIGVSLISCKKSEKMQDGYYTAEAAEYSHGWKEYVTICVMESQIVSVEYNAKNASGFIKSWDMAYMRNMNSVQGTYPNAYTRAYAAQLFKGQGENSVDMVSGASSSGRNFVELSAAVVERAKNGDTSIAVVELDHEE